MRIIVYIGIISLFLNGCSNRATSEESASSVADSISVVDASGMLAPGTYCYRQVMSRDTILLRLMVNGSEVTGELAVLPFQKDKARGAISGALVNNQIRADWQRFGEGITELHEVVFMLLGDMVTWREGERVQRQGKWILKNPDQGYQYVLMKVNCK
jgi:hypothetical protein